jgi:hypothetical protein
MNAQEIYDKIKEKYTDMDVCVIFDNEMLNWIDDDWQDDEGEYDSEFDWYIDHNNNEAEDVVFSMIVNEIYPDLENIDVDLFIELKDIVTDEMEYTALNNF